MRFGSVGGRAALITRETDAGGEWIDIEEASSGRFHNDPAAIFARWSELRSHAPQLSKTKSRPFVHHELGAPSPRPAQVFGIGLNYREHAVETGAPIPDSPLTFTKFSSSINEPFGDIPVGVPTCDWEVELVVVVGQGGRSIPVEHGWNAIAGVCVGQDISDRLLQRATQPPQFSLGKSRRGYSPFGPWLVDAESVTNRDGMRLYCTINGEEVQRSLTDDMIFTVPELVAYLSNIVELMPGDVLYTGTPSGVGGARKPPRFLAPGDVIRSTLEGVGTIVNRCIPGE